MADSQFVIDVAAAMPAGEATVAQLDKLTEKLMGGGRGAEQFSNAIAKVSASLDAARVASTAANASLAAGESEYARLERAALEAAKAAEKAALKNGMVVPPDALARWQQAEAAVNAYAGTLRKLEGDAAKATAGEKDLARQLENVKKLGAHVDKSLRSDAEALEKLRGALAQSGGAAGRLGSDLLAPVQGFTKLSASIGAAKAAAVVGAAAVVALTVVVIALGAALAAGVVSVAAWAVGLADAARSAGLAREAVEAFHPELEGVRQTIKSLAGETGLAENQIQKLGAGLLAAGESGEGLARSLRVATLAERALGAGGAATYTTLVKAAADATKAAQDAAEKTGAVPKELKKRVADATAAVERFAATAETKLGGIVARQMLGLEAQGDRLKKNIASVFGGLNIDLVLAGVSRLVSLFDTTTASGKTLKFLFETIFQPLIDRAETAAIVIEAFALGFLKGLLKIFIAAKPTIKALGEIFGFDDKSLAETLTDAGKLGEKVAAVVVALAVVFGVVLAAALGVVALAFVALVAPVYVLIKVVGFLADAFRSVIAFFTETDFVALGSDAIGGIASGIMAKITAIADAIRSVFQPAIDFVKGIDYAQVGKDIILGLVHGVTQSGPMIVGALKGVVSDAISAAKSALGIASPSKVFAELGVNTGEGFERGIARAAPAAHEAVTALVAPPAATDAPATGLQVMDAGLASAPATMTPAAPAAPGAAPAAASTSRTIDLRGSHITFQGVPDGETAVVRFGEWLTRTIEGDAAQAGGAEAPA